MDNLLLVSEVFELEDLSPALGGMGVLKFEDIIVESVINKLPFEAPVSLCFNDGIDFLTKENTGK